MNAPTEVQDLASSPSHAEKRERATMDGPPPTADVELGAVGTTGSTAVEAVVSMVVPSPISPSKRRSHGLWPAADHSWVERIVLVVSVSAWYLISIVSIVTTKLLLMEWNVPPLLLTFQQLLTGTILLRNAVYFLREGGLQPWPWKNDDFIKKFDTLSSIPSSTPVVWSDHSNFLSAGIFNALDFLASNAAFSQSAASFVETIKSSEPITTTAVALLWNVDSLSVAESASLGMLIAGVLLSTWGNAELEASPSSDLLAPSMADSLRATAIVMTANICFAFRAIFQKRYQIAAGQYQLDDINLLCRMQQIGALSLLFPVLVLHPYTLWQSLTSPSSVMLSYLGLASVNALSYTTYNLASCFVLNKLTVLQHSSFNCLRRLVAIIATCIFFGVPLSLTGVMGVLTSFVGFFAFTHFRVMRRKLEKKESHA